MNNPKSLVICTIPSVRFRRSRVGLAVTLESIAAPNLKCALIVDINVFHLTLVCKGFNNLVG